LTGPTAAFPGKITWNFEKFLVNREGEVHQRFAPGTTPSDSELIQALEALL